MIFNDPAPSGNGITKDTFKATALIVEKSGDAQSIRIEYKEKIKKVLEGIKNGVETKEAVLYLSYDEEPDLNLDENIDSFVLVSKN